MHNPEAFTIHATVAELSHAVAKQWVLLARQAIQDRGAFHVALAGGSTPKQLYTLLATAEYADQIDWPAIHFYFGDERSVPADNDSSNYHMANETLLNKVAVNKEHIHRIRAERADIQQAAHDYSELLNQHLSRDDHKQLQFDLVLLGIGNDGHTASLFPATDILEKRDTAAAAVYVEKLSSWRISLTYPLLENARQILLLVAGANKANIINDIFNGHDGLPYPVEQLHGQHQLHWHLDVNAAAQISENYDDAYTGC